jgi:hypothetical protein
VCVCVVPLCLLQVVGSTYQVLESPNPATYIGSGKVAEVAAAVQAAKVRGIALVWACICLCRGNVTQLLAAAVCVRSQSIAAACAFIVA